MIHRFDQDSATPSDAVPLLLTIGNVSSLTASIAIDPLDRSVTVTARNRHFAK
ncbi:MAG TPA: hypothetical protein VNV82_06585 [Bryobacteraceae bacterium]|nr:hypothetical protein [Bryobacteraceae bacterium]